MQYADTPPSLRPPNKKAGHTAMHLLHLQPLPVHAGTMPEYYFCLYK